MAVSDQTSLDQQVEDEWDEDEFDYDDLVRTYEDYESQLKDLAERTSRDPTALEEALTLFDEMFKAYVMTEDEALYPDAHIYNLLLEVHAFSTDPGAAGKAEEIVRRMKDDSELPPPDAVTYGNLMDAWMMRRNEWDKVRELFDELQQSSDSDLRPNTYLYNKLIKSYGMQGDATEAESVLEEMIKASEDDKESDIRPNQKTWVHVLRAHANTREAEKKDPQMAVDKIQSVLGRMERGFQKGEKDWKPGTQAYNALLQALSHVNTLTAAREADKILNQLMDDSSRDEVEAAEEQPLNPDSNSFYHVISAYRNALLKDSKAVNTAAVKVERLLELQDGLAKSHPALRPTPKTLQTVLQALSRSRDTAKAVKSQRLLERLKKMSDDTGSSVPVSAYKSLLSACAYTRGSPEDKLEAFQIAVETLNELRDSGRANSSVFGLFLRTCTNLMPATKKRDAVVENAFRKCCADGLVNDYVQREFERAASDELLLRVLGGFPEDGVRAPAEWSRLVQEK
jgi:pentatricopeptide repeat protein